MHSEDWKILALQVKVDALQIVNDDVSAVCCKSVIVLFWDVEHEFQTFSVVALRDAAHLLDVNAALDL